MKPFLISYDLDKPGQNYEVLTDRLKQLGAVKVLYSEWILVSSESAAALRDDLRAYVDSNDMLLVLALTGEAAWTKLMIGNSEFKQALAA
jgi:hypothetical protein